MGWKCVLCRCRTRRDGSCPTQTCLQFRASARGWWQIRCKDYLAAKRPVLAPTDATGRAANNKFAKHQDQPSAAACPRQHPATLQTDLQSQDLTADASSHSRPAQVQFLHLTPSFGASSRPDVELVGKAIAARHPDLIRLVGEPRALHIMGSIASLLAFVPRSARLLHQLECSALVSACFRLGWEMAGVDSECKPPEELMPTLPGACRAALVICLIGWDAVSSIKFIHV